MRSCAGKAVPIENLPFRTLDCRCASGYWDYRVGITDKDVGIPPAAVLVWLALLRLANQARQRTLRLRITLIAHHAALGYKATLGALHRLADLGLVTIVQHGARRPDEASNYTLRATVPPSVSMTDGTGRLAVPDGQTDINPINTEMGEHTPHARSLAAGRAACFVPPTAAEARAYADSIGLSASEADGFCDHFTSNGWKVGGKAPMRDWKAAMRTWQRRSRGGGRVPVPVDGQQVMTSDESMMAYRRKLNGEGVQ